MHVDDIDFIVIGSGPSGQKGAIQASKMGKSVAIIEAWEIGGCALWSATVPSKALREAILDFSNFQTKSFYAIPSTLPESDEIVIGDLNHRVTWVKEHLKETLIRQLRKNRIELVKGKARFSKKGTVEVTNKNDVVTRIFRPKRVLIATGSKPRTPAKIPIDGKRIFTSSGLLDIENVPKSMIVVGAGVIGAEYASMFSILQTKVTLVDKRDRILSFLDREIGSHLQISMEENGLKFIGGKAFKTIEVVGEEVVVTFDDGSELTAETALIAAGREANVGCLNIEAVGLKTNEWGYLEVNEHYRTEAEHIYAAGDVIGGPCLSSTAFVQGRLAALNAWGRKINRFNQPFPFGIYTIPEISSIGFTEEQLIREGKQYAVGRAYYYEVSRSVITGSESGLCKLLFDPESLLLLGAHIIGRGATELIHIAQLAISFNAKIDYFIEEVFNFPTFAEMYRIAALNGINKLNIGSDEGHRGDL